MNSLIQYTNGTIFLKMYFNNSALLYFLHTPKIPSKISIWLTLFIYINLIRLIIAYILFCSSSSWISKLFPVYCRSICLPTKLSFTNFYVFMFILVESSFIFWITWQQHYKSSIICRNGSWSLPLAGTIKNYVYSCRSMFVNNFFN